jgi:rhodanese-related sulfurtransferase
LSCSFVAEAWTKLLIHRRSDTLGHIAGSLNISRGKLEMNVEEKINDLNTVILCYCNAFNRGALSAATLQSMGYKNAKFISGGLNAYRKLV